MNTISSNKSLLLLKQNINGSNISNLDLLYLKPFYLKTFSSLKEYAEVACSKKPFIDKWHAVCNEIKGELLTSLKQLGYKVDDAMLVCVKFQGNLGEIMAEKIFRDFGSFFGIVSSTYDTVDPDNEEFVDAWADYAGDGLPIGIQVKNYTAYANGLQNSIKREVFTKALAMDSRWVREEGRVPMDKLQAYFSIPRQWLFTFTDPKQLLMQDYAKSVKVLGPAAIKPLELEKKPYIFEQLCQEIQQFTSSGSVL